MKTLLLALIPASLILFSWLPGFAAPYQYDDYVTPLKDPASQSIASFFQSLPETLRPLTKLTYAVESSLGLREAPQRRVLNALIFLISAALVALLSRASGLRGWLSVLLATLWAAHPVHAETVIALAGRSVLLSLCLVLVSANLLLRERVNWAMGCALLAVLARETALPWLLVCAGFRTVPRRGGALRPLFVALGLSALIGCGLVFASGRMRDLLTFSFDDPSAVNRLGLQWAALSRGAWMWLFEPAGFSVDIDFAPRGGTRLNLVLLAVTMYAVGAWLALGRSRPAPLRLAALLWLALALPVHSLVPKLDALTARSVSSQSAAWVMLLAFSLSSWLARHELAFGHGNGRGWPRTPWMLAGAVVMWILLLAPLTHERAHLYRDPIALWRDAAKRSTHHVRPLINLGTLLAQKGQLVEARETLERAVRIDASSSEARAKLSAVETLMETQDLLKEP
jgi:hypothetical protein